MVLTKLRALRPGKATDLVEAIPIEILAYYAVPNEHWQRICANNPLERSTREIRQRARVVG